MLIVCLYPQVAGSLSDGLNVVHGDQKHNTKRQQIRTSATTSGGQIMSGIKGLGHGMYGGLKSVFKPIEGARQGGAEVRNVSFKLDKYTKLETLFYYFFINGILVTMNIDKTGYIYIIHKHIIKSWQNCFHKNCKHTFVYIVLMGLTI